MGVGVVGSSGNKANLAQLGLELGLRLAKDKCVEIIANSELSHCSKLVEYASQLILTSSLQI